MQDFPLPPLKPPTGLQAAALPNGSAGALHGSNGHQGSISTGNGSDATQVKLPAGGDPQARPPQQLLPLQQQVAEGSAPQPALLAYKAAPAALALMVGCLVDLVGAERPSGSPAPTPAADCIAARGSGNQAADAGASSGSGTPDNEAPPPGAPSPAGAGAGAGAAAQNARAVAAPPVILPIPAQVLPAELSHLRKKIKIIQPISAAWEEEALRAASASASAGGAARGAADAAGAGGAGARCPQADNGSASGSRGGSNNSGGGQTGSMAAASRAAAIASVTCGGDVSGSGSDEGDGGAGAGASGGEGTDGNAPAPRLQAGAGAGSPRQHKRRRSNGRGPAPGADNSKHHHHSHHQHHGQHLCRQRRRHSSGDCSPEAVRRKGAGKALPADSRRSVAPANGSCSKPQAAAHPSRSHQQQSRERAASPPRAAAGAAAAAAPPALAVIAAPGSTRAWPSLRDEGATAQSARAPAAPAATGETDPAALAAFAAALAAATAQLPAAAYAPPHNPLGHAFSAGPFLAPGDAQAAALALACAGAGGAPLHQLGVVHGQLAALYGWYSSSRAAHLRRAQDLLREIEAATAQQPQQQQHQQAARKRRRGGGAAEGAGQGAASELEDGEAPEDGASLLRAFDKALEIMRVSGIVEMQARDAATAAEQHAPIGGAAAWSAPALAGAAAPAPDGAAAAWFPGAHAGAAAAVAGGGAPAPLGGAGPAQAPA